MSNKSLAFVLGGILSLLAVPSCDLSVPDLNNPGLGPLENNPTVAGINAAATGLLVGNRAGKTATTGLVNQLGILGRESITFDPNDSRFVTELLQGNLQRGSPFGGVFWAGNYNNIQLAYILVHALDKISDGLYPVPDKMAVRGFAHTIIALELLTVVLTHGDTGAPIDVDRPIGADIAPFVSKAEVYDRIKKLLDDAQGELTMARDMQDTGDPDFDPDAITFPFPLSPGYSGFTTLTKYIQFNRAIRAKVAVYTKDYAGALTYLKQSFMNDDNTKTGFSLNTGVFHSFSTNPGDVTNGLGGRTIFAHPNLKDEALKQMDGKTLDARYGAKIRDVNDNDPDGSTPADTTLTSAIKFKLYTNTTALPLIRNEELILLEAEALWFSDPTNPTIQTQAVAKLNVVHTVSGKLVALDPATITDTAKFTDALLYERRYSLMFEGGHRWIDLQRFNRSLMATGESSDHIANLRYPVPQAECDARGTGFAPCQITSDQVIN